MRRFHLIGWRGTAVGLACLLLSCASGTAERSEVAAPTTSAPVAPPATSSPTLAPTTTAGGAAATTTTTARVTSLPLGDGRRSTSPQAGSVWSCQTTFGAAAGAFRDGPWIKADGTWDPTAKLAVEGEVRWDQAQYSEQTDGATRVITTNGVPGQSVTGVFPIAAADPAYQYDRNPNAIAGRTTAFRLPVEPAVAGTASCVPMGAIGVLTDGVALFNALDAQGRDAAAHEVLDRCDGHPERTGQYHHHTVPACLLDRTTGSPALVGYALDGFGIYVERKPDGSLLTNADLDDCHGRTGPVDWDGRRVTMYHYVATFEYPYTVGCFRGSPTGRP